MADSGGAQRRLWISNRVTENVAPDSSLSPATSQRALSNVQQASKQSSCTIHALYGSLLQLCQFTLIRNLFDYMINSKLLHAIICWNTEQASEQAETSKKMDPLASVK